MLTPASVEPDDSFGYSLSMSSDKLVIGAYREDGENNSTVNSGAVYTYTWNGTHWGLEFILRPNVSVTSLNFGTSISMSGDKLAVGADGATSSKGSAYIYTWNGTQWGSEVILKPSSLESGDKFGKDIAISSDRIAIGAIGDDGTDNSKSGSGAVYTYVLENSSI
jgi:hypothetical protein